MAVLGYILVDGPDVVRPRDPWLGRALDDRLCTLEEAERRAAEVNSHFADGYVAARVARVEVDDD